MKLRLSIARAITLFGAVTACGFLLVVLTSAYSLRELKVGGPLYGDIKLGSDLVADVLPPPAYVIEAYLEATLALREPGKLGDREVRLRKLHREYEERKKFWSESSLEPAIRDMLTRESDAPVQTFWRTIEDRLLPAIRKGDTAAADAAYNALTAAYTSHRSVIDKVVEAANRYNTNQEKLPNRRTPHSRSSSGPSRAWFLWSLCWDCSASASASSGRSSA